MKKEQISDAMGELSVELIEECGNIRAQSRARRAVTRTLATAASVLVVGGTVLAISLPQNPVQPPVIDTDGPGETEEPTVWETEEPYITDPALLPTLEISGKADGMGFEGYERDSADELIANYPWDDSWSSTTMLVYENPVEHFSFGMRKGEEKSVLYGWLEEAAEKLGVDIHDANSFSLYDGTPSESELQSLIKQCEGMGIPIPEGLDLPLWAKADSAELTITVNSDGTAQISFKSPAKLPEEYHMTKFEDARQATEYLIQTFGDMFGLEDTEVSIQIGTESAYITVYNTGDTPAETVANKALRYVRFYCGDEGLTSISYCATDINAVGAYPTITAEEARALLIDGTYLSTVPDDYAPNGITEENIMAMTLDYRSWIGDEYILPYYKFLVHLPDHPLYIDTNLYGVFYVPAIAQQYVVYPENATSN